MKTIIENLERRDNQSYDKKKHIGHVWRLPPNRNALGENLELSAEAQ